MFSKIAEYKGMGRVGYLLLSNMFQRLRSIRAWEEWGIILSNMFSKIAEYKGLGRVGYLFAKLFPMYCIKGIKHNGMLVGKS